jgi:hypothetical protein
MTMAQIDSSVDLCSILFDGRADAATALTEAVRSGPAVEKLAGMPDADRTVVLDRVGAVAADVLALDMTSILGAAWRQHTALRKAAAETMTAPGTEQVIGMYAHQVSFAYAPSVEVQVADATVVTVDLETRLEMEIRGLRAVIRAGCLIGIRGGTCEVAATLTVGDSEIRRRQRSIELPLAISIKLGIPLLGGPDLPEARTDS